MTRKRWKYTVDCYFPHVFGGDTASIKKIVTTRFGGFLGMVLRLYVACHTSDAVLVSRKVGKYLAILCWMVKPRRAKLVLYEFIFTERTGILAGLSKRAWSLLLNCFDRIYVQSTTELGYYAKLFGQNPNRFRCILFCTDTSPLFVGPVTSGYLFSAGRSNRDFDTLVKALSSTDIPIQIIASKEWKGRLRGLRNNFTISFEVTKEEYLNRLAGARLVVVPLKMGMHSQGQLALLEAMRIGKPIICSDVPGIIDYVEEGKTALCVKPENPEALSRLIHEAFRNSALLDALGRKAFEVCRRRFSEERFCKEYLSSLEELICQ